MVDAMEEFKATNAAKNEAAIEDLKRIEQETVAEAQASVDDFDALGDEQKAAEAAETAFTFEQAQL